MLAPLRRRIAFALLVVLALAQVNVAVAGCLTERGGSSMSSMVLTSSDMQAPCDGCQAPEHMSNACVLHCTSDPQLTRSFESSVVPGIERPFYRIARIEERSHAHWALDGPPVAPPPRRILLHSFLL
jgi:hypothetical protein